jgi:hypothetical protein
MGLGNEFANVGSVAADDYGLAMWWYLKIISPLLLLIKFQMLMIKTIAWRYPSVGSEADWQIKS